MFGASYVFGSEVEKAVNPKPEEVLSNTELAIKFNPTQPTATTTPK